MNKNSQSQQQDLTPAQQSAAERQRVLRKALRTTNETQDIANDTSETLSRQGEQISRISKNLDSMDKDLKTADYHTTSIGSWFGMMWNAIKGQPKTDDASAGAKAKEAENIAIANNAEAAQKQAQIQRELLAKRTNNDKKNNNNSQQQQSEHDSLEQAEQDLLDQLHASVTGVMHSAKAQNSTIKAQNEALAETEKKMDQVHGHMRQTTKKINRLI